MLKCSGNDDIITIKADDGSDTVTFMFESPSKFISPPRILIFYAILGFILRHLCLIWAYNVEMWADLFEFVVKLMIGFFII